MIAMAKDFTSKRQMLPKTFWRDAPPQHFDTHSGNYQDLNGEAYGCVASRGVELLPDNTLRATEAEAQVTDRFAWHNLNPWSQFVHVMLNVWYSVVLSSADISQSLYMRFWSFTRIKCSLYCSQTWTQGARTIASILHCRLSTYASLFQLDCSAGYGGRGLEKQARSAHYWATDWHGHNTYLEWEHHDVGVPYSFQLECSGLHPYVPPLWISILGLRDVSFF